MKVLIVNTTEHTGGAAIAASRLAAALRSEGAEVTTLTRQASLPFYLERLRVLAACSDISSFFGGDCPTRKNLWQLDVADWGEDITRTKAFQEADVVHLHWVNQGFLSLKGIEKIVRSGKRIVWTLHDQWPYTGICHYTEPCDRYQTHCGHCPMIARPAAHDLSYRVFEKKRRIYADANITFVGCSQWMANLARRSPLTHGQRVVSIPNAIDPAVFCPMPKDEARREFGLPQDKPIVLFICQKVTDERKGMKYLEEAMRELPEVEVVRVGRGGDFEISGEKRMAQMYCAADVFVTPSLQDNLPNTIVEAMSCGTPCVGFHVGGIPEMIHHLQDGYVARYRDAHDLAEGIRFVLHHPELRQAALLSAQAAYAPSCVAQRYMREAYGVES